MKRIVAGVVIAGALVMGGVKVSTAAYESGRDSGAHDLCQEVGGVPTLEPEGWTSCDMPDSEVREVEVVREVKVPQPAKTIEVGWDYIQNSLYFEQQEESCMEESQAGMEPLP